MEYSLHLLLELGGFSKAQYEILDQKTSSRYHTIQLIGNDEMTLEEGTLYLQFSDADMIAYRSEVFAECSLKSIAVILFEDHDQAARKEEINLKGNRLNSQIEKIVFNKDVAPVTVFNRICKLFERLNQQEDAFYKAFIVGKPLQEIIGLFYDYIGNPAYIVDSSFKVLAIDMRNDMEYLSSTYGRAAKYGYLSYDLVANLIESKELQVIERGKNASVIYSDYFYVPFINYNLRKGKQLLGHLFIVGMLKEITSAEVELVDCYGKIIEDYMASDIGSLQKRGNAYEYFLQDILEGKLTDIPVIERQMRPLGFNRDTRLILAVLEQRNTEELEQKRIFQQLEQIPGSKSFYHKGYIVTLIPAKMEDTCFSIRKKLTKIAEKIGFRGGLSDFFSGFECMPICYKQGEAAISMAEYKQVQIFNECAIPYMLDIMQKADWQFLINQRIRTLIAYDREHAAHLAETLRIYLENNQNAIQTAEALYIHRNTLTYRLKKIQEIAELDLTRPDSRFRIVISLWLLMKEERK
ncbi:MAG: helix-turn-helix domain-containing protein [Lachnospiraceae bacterium]|nr:helix-turn-helix domain-containing protein [Lachnospiraceae bacterium]